MPTTAFDIGPEAQPRCDVGTLSLGARNNAPTMERSGHEVNTECGRIIEYLITAHVVPYKKISKTTGAVRPMAKAAAGSTPSAMTPSESIIMYDNEGGRRHKDLAQ